MVKGTGYIFDFFMTDVNLSICQKTKERAIIGFLKWGPSFLNLMPQLGDVS